MKTLITSTFLLLALLLPATAIAHDFEVDGIFYYIDGNNAVVTFEGAYLSSYYSGDVVIPETVTYDGTTYTVTKVGQNAFYGCKNLNSVTIGDSVTTIYSSAFRYSYATSVFLGKSVSTIEMSAFWNCSHLLSIIVASDNPVLDSRDSCNAIIETSSNTLLVGGKNTVIPNTVTTIGEYAFYGSGIANVDIPSSVTTIGYHAFSMNLGIRNVTIPNTVTTIANRAFWDCGNLNSVEIGNSVNSIGTQVFGRCQNLRSIVVANDNPNYDSRDNCNAIIETSTNKLIAGCMNTVIPNTVTAIGESAFYGCSELTSIDVPNSVFSIGNGAFDETGWYQQQPYGLVYAGLVAYKYKSYTAETIDVTIKEGTLGIADCAFLDYSEQLNVVSVTFPNSLIYIGRSAFEYCNGLTSVTIPESVTYIGDYAFSRCSGLETINYNAVACADHTFSYTFFPTTNVTAINFGDKVERIPDFFIQGAPKLTSITIPKTVTYIGKHAFYNCSSLDTINFNAIACADLTNRNTAFDGCNNVTTINFGDNVERIPANLAYRMKKLTSVTIPNTVTYIGDRAFYQCNGMTRVTCLATTPPTIEAHTFTTYTSTNGYIPLYVPANSVPDYKAADYWMDFHEILPLDGEPGDVNGDGNVTIADVTALIAYILSGNTTGIVSTTTDLNGDGIVNIADVTALISYLLRGSR